MFVYVYTNDDKVYRKTIGSFTIWGTDRECVVIHDSQIRNAMISFQYFRGQHLTDQILSKLWLTGEWECLKRYTAMT